LFNGFNLTLKRGCLGVEIVLVDFFYCVWCF
jgi:hypothetical protein